MVPAEQDSPGDPAGVLALEEKRLGFAVLEAEDLAVTTDEQLTLEDISQCPISRCPLYPRRIAMFGGFGVRMTEIRHDGVRAVEAGRRYNAPCQGRSFGR